MRLAQLTGYNTSGKGFWHHVLPEGNVCTTMGRRVLVTAPGVEDYWLDEYGNVELARVFRAVSEDNGN
jgi:hypothetical protein